MKNELEALHKDRELHLKNIKIEFKRSIIIRSQEAKGRTRLAYIEFEEASK